MSRFGSFWWIGIVVALAVALLPGCGGSAETTATSGDDQQATEETAATDDEAGDEDPYATGIHHVIIDVEGYGQIEVEVNANAAPITVSNFCHLVEDGFYDGLTFHRIIAGFMIQGGDPLGNGTGGSSQTITGEFSSNGIMNPIQHKRGVISMARSQDPNSASSQFFIMHQDAESLDGNYAAFGRVTSGMEVVDAIAENTPVEDENGTVAPENQPRITSITLVD
ncbi:MAG: peptidylprolyl isomerase [Atopobiaceae bacterium]|nr:peptidylprolyl isomerase [Atopobiaceae bacterium]MBQ3282343.1 peptidylprolyl isomerase [Atopobiaceae bacterium]MBQ6649647.1 peptidylprolyl isomerase [Atopobiaceae bacterium]MBR3384089.1 peptidylprolyl isomerase [Atopobiaceae bacterium]